ncbi:MAG: FkbM family methyltransferase [Verrucomicrobiota bacterium]
MDTRLCTHHVGGRGGSQSFPYYPQFSQDIINVLYEADASCVDQIKNFWSERYLETIVLPYCIGEKHEKRPFYIYFNPYESSLLKPNPAYKDFYLPMPESGPVDHLMSENSKVVEEVEVEVFPLDEVIQKDKIPPPNFLSVDTQGTSLNILRGAEKAIQKHVVGMCLETGFHSFYLKEELFGDICKWAHEHDFLFVKFLHIGQRAPFRCPLGFRGEGMDYYADSLFLRSVESVCDMQINKEEKYLLLHQLAFVAMIYHQVEYALKALLKARQYTVNDALLAELQKRTYGKMNQDVLKAYDSQPHVYPPTYNKASTT